MRPVEPESEFVIKIHDINDNEPTFPEEIYTASVPEMSVVGEFIYNVYGGIQNIWKIFIKKFLDYCGQLTEVMFDFLRVHIHT